MRLKLSFLAVFAAVTLSAQSADYGNGNGNNPTLSVEWQSIAVCDIEPNQVEIRGHNVNSVDIKIVGEIYAKPDGGSAILISSVPVPYQTVPPDGWGGPEERIVNQFPQGFSGVVYGSAQAFSIDGALISQFEMPQTTLKCGQPPTLKVDWHHFAVCDVEPNEVEIRGHNVNSVDVKIVGEIYARPDGGSAILISAVPVPYQTVPPDGDGGPDERIVNVFPKGFAGVVYGKAQAYTVDGTFISEDIMPETRLKCGLPPPPPPPNGCEPNCPPPSGEDTGGSTNPKPKIVDFTIDPNFELSAYTGESMAWRVVFIYDDDSTTTEPLFPVTASIRSESTASGATNNCFTNICTTQAFETGYVLIDVSIQSLNLTKRLTIDVIPPATNRPVEPLLVVTNFPQVNPGAIATACVVMPRSFRAYNGTFILTVEYGRRVRKNMTVSLKRDIAQGEQFCLFKREVSGLNEEGPETISATLKLGSVVAEGESKVWYKYGGIKNFDVNYLNPNTFGQTSQNQSEATLGSIILTLPSSQEGVIWEEIGIMLGGKMYIPLRNLSTNGPKVSVSNINRGFSSELIPGYYDVSLIGRKGDGSFVSLVQPKALYLGGTLLIE